MAADAANAQARFELENNIQGLEASVEELFTYDREQQAAIQQAKPWRRDPHYFKHVRVSALALIKMTMHCKSGGNLEVMGMIQGKTIGDTFVVLDAFALPVEGTETRVNAQAEAYEYMVDFVEKSKMVGRQEHVVGWYHSHPGYGCWMSGIDVSTQMLNQQYQEPFLALIIDPVRTCAAGKVEIGAFRTYPEGYKPPDGHENEYQSIPLSKIEDFGVHANQYYTLDVTFFKSELDAGMLDLLWNRYWVNTLSSSPLLANREFVAQQVADLADKVEQAEAVVANSGRMGGFFLPSDQRKDTSQLNKVARDASKVAIEQTKGLATQVIKDLLFNYRPVLGMRRGGDGDVEMADA
mmetsp:Transcript_19436/g.66065  ORF Transcript_19436/g.66065 Transcript_19436/m.66065 type:complete len:352 (+) Transcript_19436:165-1220(+)